MAKNTFRLLTLTNCDTVKRLFFDNIFRLSLQQVFSQEFGIYKMHFFQVFYIIQSLLQNMICLINSISLDLE